MGNIEEERPEFEDLESKEEEEDPRERFRRLTSDSSRPKEPSSDETLGLYRAGPDLSLIHISEPTRPY